MDEIFYHVFQRSFYDSTGDQIGDLKGLAMKLDYIQALGVTSILILPLYDSIFYHNYFASDFRKIDPTYGSLQDYIDLVDAVHERGMKLYLDMEVQYVAEDHKWFKDSFENPSSPFSDHIIYNGPNNTDPESIIFNLKEIHSYDGQVKKVACLDILNPRTQDVLFEEFKFWLDPFQDASLRSGIDGFRLDHMMDDLDDKGKLTGVYSKFWSPLIQRLKKIKPELKFIGEQANWESHGEKAFTEAGVDYMFAFPLKFSISDLDVQRIIGDQMQGINDTPENKEQILILENHDTTRFATSVGSKPGFLRIGATLNILLKGIPAIYYGQELGMTGAGGFNAYGISDGNDIPRREAFPWYAITEGEGVALWYKESGPWWNDSTLADEDGISVEEQEGDAHSLLNFYRKLIMIRKSFRSIQKGNITFLDTRIPDCLAFLRAYEDEEPLFVSINFSAQDRPFHLGQFISVETLLSYPEPKCEVSVLQAYGIQVHRVKKELNQGKDR